MSLRVDLRVLDRGHEVLAGVTRVRQHCLLAALRSDQLVGLCPRVRQHLLRRQVDAWHQALHLPRGGDLAGADLVWVLQLLLLARRQVLDEVHVLRADLAALMPQHRGGALLRREVLGLQVQVRVRRVR